MKARERPRWSGMVQEVICACARALWCVVRCVVCAWCSAVRCGVCLCACVMVLARVCVHVRARRDAEQVWSRSIDCAFAFGS
jgi:hypothetical protein